MQHLRIRFMVNHVVKSTIMVGLEKIILIDMKGSGETTQKIDDPALGLKLGKRRNRTYTND